MSAVPLLQKLILLKLMNLIQHPLTADQITTYMVENGWSDYLLSQQLKLELTDSGFADVSDSEPYFYTLKAEGLAAVEMFSSQIPSFLSDQIEVFVENNRERILRENSVFVNVISDDGAYLVHVKIYTGLTLVVDLKIHRWNREDALEAAREMRNKAYDTFSFLIK